MRKIFKNPLLSGSMIMVGGSMGANVVNYVYHVVMGRVLGPVDYGVLASVFAILYIVAVVPTAASFAIVKFISSAQTKAEVASVYLGIRNFVFKLALGLATVMLVLSPVIASFLHIQTILVVLVCPIMFFVITTLVYQSALQGLLRFWGVVGPLLVASVGKLLIGSLLIMLGWSVLGSVVGILLAAFLAFLYGMKLARVIPMAEKVEGFKMKPFFLYSLPVLLQAFAFTSMFTLDQILVKHYLPSYEAGLYASLSMLGKIIFWAVQPVSAVMFPIVAKKKAKNERYKAVFYMSFLAATAVCLTAVGFYYMWPGLAIELLYGKAYLVVRGELVWMGLFISAYTLSYLVVSFLLSVGRTKVVVLPILAAVAQLILLNTYHASMLQVVQVSLWCEISLFIGLAGYLGYYQLSHDYAKK